MLLYSNKSIASSNKCITGSNKKLLVTSGSNAKLLVISASLVATNAVLVVVLH